MDNDDMLSGGADRPTEPGLLRVPAALGLGPEPDEGMERFARVTARLLGVPVALVALLEEERQILPGMVGLGEPWSSSRQVRLPHPSRLRMALAHEPAMYYDDARCDLLVRDLGLDGIGAKACAGMALKDHRDNVLGVLAAIDTVPRSWNEEEREAMRDMALACGTELRLRILTHDAQRVRVRARRAFERSRLLLHAADVLAGATDLPQIRRSLGELVDGGLRPVYVGLVLVQGDRLRRIVDTDDPSPMDVAYQDYGLDSDWPTALAVRTNTLVEVSGPEDLKRYGPEAGEGFAMEGLSSMVCVPLPAAPSPLGALVLGWESDHEMDVVERALLRSLAEYTARAVERVEFVGRRVETARLMQQAMLTDLPSIAGLRIAALYRPAVREDMVGGDWYDVYPLPDGGVAFTVGDITGHDIHAATLMGQVRSMLRQADMDHLGHGPARALTAFEHANRELGVGASGTMVHAHLRPSPEGWSLTWTNAGHMAPLVASAEGETERLDEHGLLFHPDVPGHPRTDSRRLLRPGSTLLLFTDGLVEHRGHDLDTVTDRVARMLGAGTRRPLPELLGAIADEVAGEAHDDDVVLLAVRLSADAPV
ncbi:SpoIIE family protein phosphatase [Nocardiopsis sp. ATB16-24]|uniref:SpoIIE family protein phosphatase n=1 Tax=Nocardiopsis sp. ATB16-24 TaxID=3019555 RepID=UPI0025528F9B|nr:SpoIIE family protein phosphatase [Nocardiopsis sp. ATB16-24]